MEQKIKGLIRVSNTDIDGNKTIYNGLRKIKGISFMFSNAICNYYDIEKDRKIGGLTPEEVSKIENLIQNPDKLPNWLLNRRKDYDTGKDIHISGPKMGLFKQFDVKRLQQLKSFRGLRHAWGLPLRGQRTRGNFRKGRSVGVQRKAIKQQSTKKKAGSGGKKK